MENTIKVFKMNDCDWYAGASAEDAKRAMAEWNGYPSTPEGVAEMCEEFSADPVELSAEEMNQCMFTEDAVEEHGWQRELSFRERLAEMIADGDEFPSFFASTEY